MIEQVVRTLLANDPTVKSVVAGRFYFSVKPPIETQPCIVLRVVDKQFDHTIEAPTGFATGRIQVDSFAPTYPQAKELSLAARSVLDNYSGTAFGTDAQIDIDSETDIIVVPAKGQVKPQLYGTTLDAVFSVIE